jgi:hypothetical protein
VFCQHQLTYQKFLVCLFFDSAITNVIVVYITQFVLTYWVQLSGQLVVCFRLGVSFINIFSPKAEQRLRRKFLKLWKASASGKNVPKYGAQCKSYSLKYAENFHHRYSWNRRASFAQFTSCWYLCTLHKLVGKIDSRLVPIQEKTCFQNKSKFITEDQFTKHINITIKWY